MKHIHLAWQTFEERVVPRNAGDTQRTEMRKAFFAGASTLFFTLTERVSKGSDEPNDDDMQMMNDISAEVQQFGEELDREAFARLNVKGKA